MKIALSGSTLSKALSSVSYSYFNHVHYTVKYIHSILVYQTYYLRAKGVTPNMIFKLFKIHVVNLGIYSELFDLSKFFFFFMWLVLFAIKVIKFFLHDE